MDALSFPVARPSSGPAPALRSAGGGDLAVGAGPGIDLRRAPETLHPALWLGHQLGRSGVQTVSSGFAALDAELPGGGWPCRVLSELLLPHPGVG
ncbi:MAG: hypothetical protein ACXWUL_03795, partial [Caldimonas sp.]